MRSNRFIVALVTVAVCSFNLMSKPMTANAATWSKTSTTVIYLTGTASPTVSAADLQDDYQYIYRSLAHNARLGIARTKQIVLNYTSSSSAKAISAAAAKPQVVQSVNPTKPKAAPKSCITVVDPSATDVWRHAYQVSWKIKEILDSQGANEKVVLIGHSQGGLIARIVQLIANGKIPTLAETAGEKIPVNCWPSGLKNRIIGIVTMGAPLNAVCPDFLTMVSARAWVTRTMYYSAGNVLAIGADPKEHVGISVVGDNINLECATSIYSTKVSRVAIYSKGGTLQEHTWYVEGGGACPRARLLPTLGDGQNLQYFCQYKLTNGINFPVNWQVIMDRTMGKSPGTIYDLIAKTVIGW